MSNLGRYQDITRWSKKVGGPNNLLLLVAVGGYAVIRPAEGAIKMAVNKVKDHFSKKNNTSSERIYSVKIAGISNEGVKLKVGDSFRVLERDDDACLVEIIGNKDNPYFISSKLLEAISDYKA